MGKVRKPTKKLAPRIGPELPCPHEYTEDEGLQLEIDCDSCPGAQDIGNNRCFLGIVNIVISGAAPDVIVLKRSIDKRYRREWVARVASIAAELAAINRALKACEEPSDKRCRTCPASMKLLLSRLKRHLTQDPRRYLVSGRDLSDAIRNSVPQVSCENLARCLQEALSASHVIRGDA